MPYFQELFIILENKITGLQGRDLGGRINQSFFIS